MARRWYRISRITTCALCMCLVVAAALASTARTWVIASSDFGSGKLDGAALTADGAVTIGPMVDHQFADGDPRVWAGAVGIDSVAYVAAGDGGAVTQVSEDGKTSDYFAVDGGSVHALEALSDGSLAVGASQPARVFRVSAGVAAAPVALEADYVWDILPMDDDGGLWVATGDPAAIWAVGDDGGSTIVYSAPDAHVRHLARGPENSVYGGTSGEGLVVRVDGAGDSFVLFDSPFEEVTGLGVSNGDIWVAGNPGTGDAANGSAAAANGALYRIAPSGVVEQHWEATESVHSLAVVGGDVVVGTGQTGSLHLVEGTGMRRLEELASNQIGTLVPQAEGFVAFGSNPAGVYRVSATPRQTATFLSAVRDAGVAAQWGELRFAAADRDGLQIDRGVQLFVRSGNTAEPGDSWSAWAGPFEQNVEHVGVPAARYAQVRAELNSNSTVPHVRRVELVYVPRNSRPVIGAIRAHPAGVVYRENATFEDGLPYAQLPATVEARLREQDPNAAAAGAAGSSFRGRPLFVAGQQTLTWSASDADGDALEQQLEYRQEGSLDWMPLAGALEGDVYVMDSARVRDGRYQVRLVVSDGQDNAPGTELSATSGAATFLVDNTPPMIADLRVSQGSGGSRITGVASDATSIVLRIRYSVDGQDWHTVLPADGAADSASEAFEFEVPTGTSMVVVQVTDGAMNRGADQVSVQ